MDDKRIFFMSGLQRSGSTVLCNILQQHPDVFTVPTDPFYDVIHNILKEVNHKKTGSALDFEVFDRGLHQFILDGLQGWYKSLTDKPVIVSKNRNWHTLSHLFPDVKYLATVRNLFDVANSVIKKQYNNHSISTPLDHGYIGSSHIEHVVTHYILTDESLQMGIRNLMYVNEREVDRVHFVRYEDLLQDSAQTLLDVQRFLNIEPFEFNLNDIDQQSLYEHDGYYMGQCSHVTQKKLQDLSNKPVIPERVKDFLRINNTSSWFYEAFYPVDQH